MLSCVVCHGYLIVHLFYHQHKDKYTLTKLKQFIFRCRVLVFVLNIVELCHIMSFISASCACYHVTYLSSVPISCQGLPTPTTSIYFKTNNNRCTWHDSHYHKKMLQVVQGRPSVLKHEKTTIK